MDGYDYFSTNGTPLIMADEQMADKKYMNSDYQVAARPLQTVARDRLVPRQTYAQNQKLDNPNKTITMNNGDKPQIVIGFAEGKF